jgi:hypothetical protein
MDLKKEECSVQAIHDLLRREVLKKDSALPKVTDPAIELIVDALKVYSHIIKLQAGEWENERTGVQKIKDAISVILDVFPPMREEYRFKTIVDEKNPKKGLARRTTWLRLMH